MQDLKHILYFADGDFRPTEAFLRAVALAEQHQAQITLMDVTVESEVTAELVHRFGLADDVQQCEQRLAALTHLAEQYIRHQPPRLRVTIGTPFIEVIQAVQRDGHDLVIKPVRQRQGRRNLFASTEMHLLRKCPCTVWMHQESLADPRSETTPRCRRLLAAVDPSQAGSGPLNRRILDTAATLAGIDGADLDLVHAWQAPFDDTLSTARDGAAAAIKDQLAEAARMIESSHAASLQSLAAGYRDRMGKGDTHLVRGLPAEQILARAEALDSDLIVLATLSAPRQPGLFIGSTAEDLLQGAATSVLALKPEGFVSPVQ
jgi:universal stress protein E